MGGAGHAEQPIEIRAEHIPEGVGLEPEAVHGAGRNDEDGRPSEFGVRSLQVEADRPRRDVYALAESDMPVRTDLPQVLPASRLDVFDVQGIGMPSCRRVFAVQRKARNMPACGPVHSVWHTATHARPSAPKRRPGRIRGDSGTGFLRPDFAPAAGGNAVTDEDVAGRSRIACLALVLGTIGALLSGFVGGIGARI